MDEGAGRILPRPIHGGPTMTTECQGHAAPYTDSPRMTERIADAPERDCVECLLPFREWELDTEHRCRRCCEALAPNLSLISVPGGQGPGEFVTWNVRVESLQYLGGSRKGMFCLHMGDPTRLYVNNFELELEDRGWMTVAGV